MLGSVNSQLGVLQLGAVPGAGVLEAPEPILEIERLDLAFGSWVGVQMLGVGSALTLLPVMSGSAVGALKVASGSSVDVLPSASGSGVDVLPLGSGSVE